MHYSSAETRNFSSSVDKHFTSETSFRTVLCTISLKVRAKIEIKNIVSAVTLRRRLFFCRLWVSKVRLSSAVYRQNLVIFPLDLPLNSWYTKANPQSVTWCFPHRWIKHWLVVAPEMNLHVKLPPLFLGCCCLRIKQDHETKKNWRRKRKKRSRGLHDRIFEAGHRSGLWPRPQGLTWLTIVKTWLNLVPRAFRFFKSPGDMAELGGGHRVSRGISLVMSL